MQYGVRWKYGDMETDFISEYYIHTQKCHTMPHKYASSIMPAKQNAFEAFKDTYFIHKSTDRIVPTICINTIIVLKDNASKTSYLITQLLKYFRYYSLPYPKRCMYENVCVFC